MFRNEKLMAPSRFHVFVTIAVAVISCTTNYFSNVAGYALALLTIALIGLQAWFSFRIWPTYGNAANPYVFGLYWGLIVGLILPFIFIIVANEGISGIWMLLSD